ncbi:MAG: small basic family protein [Thermoleophilia bacterium]|nr:small basic family protein [Thermoleophilia bacterium]
MYFPLIGLLLGVLGGYLIRYDVPPEYARYLSIAVLAALDSTLGGVRALLERTFNDRLFITGFLSNTILAALITFFGDRLGVNLYLAAVIAFGVRLFQNLAIIRRLVFK